MLRNLGLTTTKLCQPSGFKVILKREIRKIRNRRLKDEYAITIRVPRS